MMSNSYQYISVGAFYEYYFNWKYPESIWRRVEICSEQVIRRIFRGHRDPTASFQHDSFTKDLLLRYVI